jgi:hypothetical protein
MVFETFTMVVETTTMVPETNAMGTSLRPFFRYEKKGIRHQKDIVVVYTVVFVTGTMV